MYEAPVTDHYSQQLNEEYKIWKKHVPFLYDLLITHQLPTNSNSVQFTDPASCLIGTNAVDRNALLFLKLPMPQPETLCDMTQYKNDCQPGELGLRKIQVQTALPQNSEVMRLRVGTNGWVASKTGGADPELNVYRNQHGWKHLAKLDGHTAEGFGLDWNARNQAMLVSGSLDRKICVWDLEGTTESENTLKPICQYHFHGTGVEDVNWNKINQNMFASCGQDRLIAIWDIKEKKKKPECQKTGHTDQIYTLDFCPSSEMLLLSGGQDGDIHLWDLRNITKKVHTFAGHTDAVNKVQCCPNNRLMFASASSDRRVIIWDISKCGDERQQEDPAEMVFVHAGHRSRVLDFDWSPTGNIIASTQESNTLQVWRRSPATELEEEQ